jgi:mannosyltransferase OCH1-like enzyme
MRNHEDYEYLLWEKDDIENLIKRSFPKYLQFYEMLPSMIQKIDFAKYCIMYAYGGLYVDMDCECLKPIDSLFLKTNKKLFVVSLDVDIFEQIASNYYDTLYNNGWFASSKKNALWKQLIKFVSQQPIERAWYETNIAYIFRTTGPKAFSQIVNNFSEKEVVQSGLIDPIKWTEYTSRKDIDYSKYSNSYSIHHYGSKSLNGKSWQSNSEIMLGMMLHYLKKSWKLSAVVMVLLILDHTNSVL